MVNCPVFFAIDYTGFNSIYNGDGLSMLTPFLSTD